MAAPRVGRCAAGANVARSRELDNAVLERAAFVCRDSLENARLESGHLIEPVAKESSTGSRCTSWPRSSPGDAGRQSEDDIAVFKSDGIAAWDVAAGAAAVALAREHGIGLEL